ATPSPPARPLRDALPISLLADRGPLGGRRRLRGGLRHHQPAAREGGRQRDPSDYPSQHLVLLSWCMLRLALQAVATTVNSVTHITAGRVPASRRARGGGPGMIGCVRRRGRSF